MSRSKVVVRYSDPPGAHFMGLFVQSLEMVSSSVVIAACCSSDGTIALELQPHREAEADSLAILN